MKVSAGYVPGVLLIGLTGGIGSGKSTVSVRLADHGAVVIDADAIVRLLQVPGTPVFEAMVERFGAGIVAVDGTLDRQAVADVVFDDAEALADLGAIVHPRVAEEIARRLQEEADTDHVVILDVPLLVESGRDDLGALVVVDVDPEIAVSRLVALRGMRETDARARIARQATREDRVAKADYILDNSGSLDALHAAVDALWPTLVALGDEPQ